MDEQMILDGMQEPAGVYELHMRHHHQGGQQQPPTGGAQHFSTEKLNEVYKDHTTHTTQGVSEQSIIVLNEADARAPARASLHRPYQRQAARGKWRGRRN